MSRLLYAPFAAHKSRVFIYISDYAIYIFMARSSVKTLCSTIAFLLSLKEENPNCPELLPIKRYWAIVTKGWQNLKRRVGHEEPNRRC